MGRYETKDHQSVADLIIPPATHSAEIKDTKTGKTGKGAGFTKEEARDNAWKDLHEDDDEEGDEE